MPGESNVPHWLSLVRSHGFPSVSLPDNSSFAHFQELEKNSEPVTAKSRLTAK